MTNLEVLRQGLREFIDEATDRDLYNIISSLGYDICNYCISNEDCDRNCFTWFAIWGRQEYKELKEKS